MILLGGDSLEKLREFEDNSFDSLVTDPPAGISFMGKDWDDDKGGKEHWIAWLTDVMKQCHRVMKPGAHGLVWAIPRTSHWTATALENAGFEIRDIVTHLFGSGFPKSLDVSKAMDKAAGREREIVGYRDPKGSVHGAAEPDQTGSHKYTGQLRSSHGITDLAKQWQGFGTALKPASEHWILIRKPLSEKNVAKNVERWGCGAINIDASRIGTEKIESGRFGRAACDSVALENKNIKGTDEKGYATGRFPANLILSHHEDCEEDWCVLWCAVRLLDQQSGERVVNKPGPNRGKGFFAETSEPIPRTSPSYDDRGGASRFFYVAKASKKDRNAGLEGMPESECGKNQSSLDGGAMLTGSGRPRSNLKQNFHPTVKSTKLMEYLIKLVTPPNGKVLDPFMGSGSTGVAAKRLQFEFFGIEKEASYFDIAKTRISATQTESALE